MTPQEAYDRINMLGYLLVNEQQAVRLCGHNKMDYLDMDKIEDFIVSSILTIAESLHKDYDPNTPAGQSEAESLMQFIYLGIGREYVVQDGKIIEAPLDTGDCEIVLEEHFKDLKVNGYYLCDRQAGHRVSQIYRAQGRPRAMAKKSGDTNG